MSGSAATELNGNTQLVRREEFSEVELQHPLRFFDSPHLKEETRGFREKRTECNEKQACWKS